MAKKITKEYRKEVRKQALLDARELLGAKGEIVKLIIQIILFAVAVGLVAMAGYFGWQGSENVVRVLVGLLIGDLLILFIVWISPSLIANLNMWETAALRDKKQRETIEAYESREDYAKAKKIKFEEFIDNDATRQQYFISIKVYNGHQKNFQGQLLLTDVDNDPLDDVLELSRYEGAHRISKLEWFPDSARVIDLAYIDKESGNVFFIGENQRTIFIGVSGEHIIETVLVGSFGEYEIKPKKQKWIMLIDKQGKALSLKKKGRK